MTAARDSLEGERENLPLRIDSPTNSRFFPFLIHTYAIYGSTHGQSSPIGAIGPPGIKREQRKNARKMEAERGISIRFTQVIPLSPALANNLSALHRYTEIIMVYNPLRTKFKCADTICTSDTSTPTFESFSIFRYLIRIVISISLIHIPFLMKNQLQLLSFFYCSCYKRL